MKTWLMFLTVICLLASTWDAHKTSIQMASENERLRSYNARRQRRLKAMEMPENINMAIVATTEHLLGTPAPLVAALWKCENGPEDVETGSLDKTDYWAQNFPITYWSKLDGARTLNRMVWAYMNDHPKVFKDFLLQAALPYTNMNLPLQRAWAANMFAANESFKNKIALDKEPSVAIASITPTPDYNYLSDSHTGKVNAPTKKVHIVRRKK